MPQSNTSHHIVDIISPKALKELLCLPDIECLRQSFSSGLAIIYCTSLDSTNVSYIIYYQYLVQSKFYTRNLMEAKLERDGLAAMFASQQHHLFIYRLSTV